MPADPFPRRAETPAPLPRPAILSAGLASVPQSGWPLCLKGTGLCASLGRACVPASLRALRLRQPDAPLTLSASEEQARDRFHQSRAGAPPFAELVKIPHQVVSDEQREYQEDGSDAEQSDREPAPLGLGVAGENHRGHRPFGTDSALGRGPAGRHLARNRRLEAVVFVLFVFGERRGRHGGRGVLIDGLLVDCEDFRAGVAVFQIEVAGRFELDSLVVGITIAERDIDFEVGIVEDVLFALLHSGWRRGGQRRLGF